MDVGIDVGIPTFRTLIKKKYLHRNFKLKSNLKYEYRNTKNNGKLPIKSLCFSDEKYTQIIDQTI